MFSKFSYFNLKLGIKQSKIGYQFAEEWLLKVKILGPADEQTTRFFEKCANFMAHSAVCGNSPIQRQNTNSKKLTIEKLSMSGLRSCTKFGQAHPNDERKIRLSSILHFILDFRI